jgi:hypothetical protein
VFVWECLLCQLLGLNSESDILRHVQSPGHESRHKELNASCEDLCMETVTLVTGREEHRCRLCDTGTMMVDRLASHFNGARHRQAIRNLLHAAAGTAKKDEDRSTTTAIALSVTSTEAMSDVPSASASRSEDDDDSDMDRLEQQVLSVLDDATSPTPLALPTAASAARNVAPLATPFHSSGTPLKVSPTISSSEALLTLAKVEKCREIQHQISHLPETHKHHINHILLQHVLCSDEPTQGVLLSLAMVYVNDYTLQQNQPANRISSNKNGTAEPMVVDTRTGSESMSTFRKHLPQDSYLSPTVVKSTVALPLDGSTDDAITPSGASFGPPLAASSAGPPYNGAAAPTQRDVGSRQLVQPETAHDVLHSSPVPPVLLDSPTSRRKNKSHSNQDCDFCSIL